MAIDELHPKLLEKPARPGERRTMNKTLDPFAAGLSTCQQPETCFTLNPSPFCPKPQSRDLKQALLFVDHGFLQEARRV